MTDVVQSNGSRVPTAEEVIQAVYEGRVNSQFEELMAALQYQMQVTNSQVTWRFQWEGRTVDKRHLPLKVCRVFQTLVGQTYTVMHPANAEHARAIIAALLIVDGVEQPEALRRADEANGWEIASTLVEEAVPGDPFGGTSTGSSTSTPDDPGSGRQR